ncbi:hypothetical protein E3T26_09450 [Cryobacterium sp. TMT1-21]|uniref:Uncharacterized protein n=1 Tax=Cryobacterium shii TaxID=1259235 RepID=A0AAQ2C6B8_9MICO|nr:MULTISPECIES: hypothetical protein [Cryobacterium]TFC47100.1 hypothetical protein E3O49_08935 [Cryobacterium shii]TFC88205.1 hypothetical protein E3T24_03475 [Cryobacterium sp. TmT2-59]TFD13085.1 hypothetical protein E3T42_14435 [Cryobacterium sp. TMT4-10]TFD13821.1 hypothetical protein E3T26_09450 [Cryobacterium sp. TMT1-21]TFD16974.1 hypothetical protein E3T32_14490 [Cryobacterium sp. TMT2-23]
MVRYAWICVAVLPVSFVAAMILGDALLSLQGYDSGTESPIPIGVLLLAGIPAVLVLIAPTVPAMWFGFRARRLGASSGLIPAVIGATVLAFGVLTNTLPLLFSR